MGSRDLPSENGNVELLRFSDLVEVNPPVDCSHLDGADAVSFIPMSDVSNNGQWTIRQSRSYGEVRTGYTAFSEGDILFAKITPCTENGKGCHAVNLTNGVGFGSTEFHVLRAKHGVNSRLVYHLSVAPDVRVQAAAVMGGSAGQQRVPTDFFKLLRVSETCLQQQDTYADLLDAMESAIEGTRAVIDQTRKLKTALLQDLLTNGLPGRHKQFQPFRHIGHIPESWRIVTFNDLADVVRGSSPRPAGDPRYFNGDYIPWITVLEATGDDWLYLNTTTSFLTEEGKKNSRTLEEGTLLLTNSGATLGVPKITSMEACANDGIAAFLNLNDKANKLFLYYYLYQMTSTFRDVIAPGLGQPNLNTDLIGTTPVPLPSLDEQELIASTLLGTDEKIRVLREHIASLIQVKTALSQALLTGRIRVPTKRGERW